MQGFNEFRLPPVILYGRDSLTKLGEQASSLGSKTLLVSDRIMEKIGNVAKCQEQLEQCGVSVVCYLDVNTEPTDVYVAEATQLLLEHNCDSIVAIGGGSCIDAAKAVSVVASNGGYIGDYSGGQKSIMIAPIPLIAIPTTAGTGSEMTSVTVITNPETNIKLMIKHPTFIPAVAIVDPLMTLSTPPPVTAATGVDALCHAIEAYISKKAQPLTDKLALSAIERIAGNIRTAFTNGSDIDAREQMALASMEAGAAFTNASVTLVHAMSRPIGAMFHVPHGISNAMLLPAVLEFTCKSAITRMATIGRLLRPDLSTSTDELLATTCIKEIKQLCKQLEIPNMKTYGIGQAQLDQVVDKMATDAITSGSPGNNPKVPTHEEIVALYYRCYEYDFSK
ncbi:MULTISPECIES: iron-containing alcohol dehydrogenase [unclassified Paenibacillus]|uniref:iron-containing alcohol dehydrogenase n=1 Tax=unclassified Paenibacillus TaxID=185978 RepID=UPI0036455E44